MQIQKISRVVMLVHPFFSSASYWSLNRDVKITKKNIDFLAGLWGKQIKQAQGDPNAIFILVKDFEPNPKMRAESYFAERKLERMIAFARKSLGTRFFEIDKNIFGKMLESQLAQRNMQIDRRVFSGKSFGEWWDDCVKRETTRLAAALNVPRRRISQSPGLSITSPYTETDFGRRGLGFMTLDLRAEALKKRRRAKKALRKKPRVPAK